MIRVLILWHMHQPYYKDLVEGEYRLPWTRLHALKDYYGMVALLEEFPEVRVVFNVVPSLVAQIEEYAARLAREPVMELAFKPARWLTREERLGALAWFFQANYDHLIARYPRYRQLHGVFRSVNYAPERALPMFADQDIADLQVLSQLAWFDEFYQESDPVVRRLVEKGREFPVEDQQALRAKHDELLGRVLGAYRAAQDRGQVELTTSPFYHPILPLVCDSNIGAEAHPGMSLPRRFSHPEDARLQLERAVALHERVFGRRPRGLWPSEGSVSDEALRLAAEAGFIWAATDEGILARTLGGGFARDSLYAGYDLLTPSGRLRLYFRDHTLSDLIGFVYSNMDPQDAARDLLARIKRAAAGLENPLVSIILDGENAWEYYPRNGREFLRCFYRGLSADPELRTVTGSEAQETLPALACLPHIAPGSWINSNFDIWIGAREDHRAWDLLSDTREFFEDAAPGQPPEQVELAREELLIAEGSDWCWWYGPEHHSAHDREFDQLYRAHLANVYRALEAAAPAALAQPIARAPERVFHAPPSAYVRPRVDGRVTSYFEWLGAGLYCPDQRTSAMHGRRFYLQQMYYGLDEENFYLRLDFFPGALDSLKQAEATVRLNVDAGAGARARELVAGWPPGGAVEVSLPGEAEACLGRVFEMRASLRALGVGGVERFRFQVVLEEDGLPVDLLPAEDWLEVETAEPT